MNDITLQPGTPDTDTLHDGPPNPRCRWDESVCAETPEYYVVELYAGDESDAITYCPRHYVLHLAHVAQVHLPTCPGPANEHIKTFGRLT